MNAETANDKIISAANCQLMTSAFVFTSFMSARSIVIGVKVALAVYLKYVSTVLKTVNKGNISAKIYLLIDSRYISPNVPMVMALHWKANMAKSLNVLYGESLNSESMNISAYNTVTVATNSNAFMVPLLLLFVLFI